MEWLRREWAVYIEENETYTSEIEHVKNETFRYPTEIPHIQRKFLHFMIRARFAHVRDDILKNTHVSITLFSEAF